MELLPALRPRLMPRPGLPHRKRRAIRGGCAVLVAACLLSGCVSIKRMAVNQVGNALAGGGGTFASDDDPELIKQAVPFSLKLMESLLAQSPRHPGLLLATASGFTQYSYAFVQLEAEALAAEDLAAARALQGRARRLYLRARDYGLRGLDAAHEGFSELLATDPPGAVARAGRRDVPLLYWTAASWAAAISLSKDDARLISDLPKVEALIDRALALDESWDDGAIHAFLIAFEMGRATGAGDRVARARGHFERALELSQGRQAGLFVGYAEAVCIEQEDRAQFESLLERALALDPDANPPTRLANLLAQGRARRLLQEADRLFLPPIPPET